MVRGGGACGVGGLDRIARAERADQRGAGVALDLKLRRAALGIAPQGAENGGERGVGGGRVEGEARGGGGLRGHGGGANLGAEAAPEYTQG